ncbi:MAG: hypothetical protein Q8N47_24900 [Bryobacterales bacterium]|nr:hypothetical protein [Bryobacterales bacterium]
MSPAILYRRGSEQVYWFAGGGFGGRIDRMYDRCPGRRLYVVAAHVAPDAGAKLGIGYRF